MRKLLIASLAAIPFASAAPAHADGSDYVADLNRHGVPYTSVANAIEFAHTTCGVLDNGYTFGDLMALHTSTDNWSLEQLGEAISAAVDDVCPWNQAAVMNQMAHYYGSGH